MLEEGLFAITLDTDTSRAKVLNLIRKSILRNLYIFISNCQI